jgi:hypothetical protein
MRVVEETWGRVYGNLINRGHLRGLRGLEKLDNSWKM